MKRIGMGLAIWMTAAGTMAAEPAAKPNLMIILADDLGYGDLSCYGAKDIRTPNIDRLAAEGTRFTRFRANCCVCSPTRAALLTGRYQERVGVPGVIRTEPTDNWGRLSRDAVLLPAALKAAAYESAIVGKWHLGLRSPDTPNERGFDFFHGFLGDMMDDYYTHLRGGLNFMRRNSEAIEPEGHATDLFTDWACDYIKDPVRRDKPFFLYLAYNAPHGPIQPPADWLEKVRARETGSAPARAKLAALIEHLDDGVGRVMAALRASGLEGNTLVIFTSDNGGDLPAAATCGDLRDGKGSMYEGGLRVPFIARWPGRVGAGRMTDREAVTMDLFPMALELAGLPAPSGIDGVSLLPTLLSPDAPPLPARDLFFTRREGGSRFGGKTIDALIRGDWKLLQNSPYAPLELYNLKQDPLEQTDLSGREKKIFNELSAALQTQVQRGGGVPWQ